MDSSWEAGALSEDGKSIVERCHIVLLFTIGCFDDFVSLEWLQWIMFNY